jgi:hypothetical protein
LSFVLGCGATALIIDRKDSPLPAAPATATKSPSANKPGPSLPAREKSVATNDQADKTDAKPKDGEKPKSPFDGLAAMFSGEAMGPMIAASTKSMYLAKADKLATRLKLSPDQKQSLAMLMEAQAKEETERTTKMLGMMKDIKDNPEAMAQAAANIPKSDTNAQIRQWATDNLSPEQQENLERYRQDRRNANAEKIAQMQLDQINESIDLDESQRDRLFQHFAREALANGSAGDDLTDAGVMGIAAAGTDPNAPDPLADILTPEQLAGYKEHQQNEEKRSLEMMKSLGLDPSKFDGTGGGAKVFIAPSVKVNK